jgi:transposase-like protein
MTAKSRLCPDCGHAMTQTTGLSEDERRFLCTNPDCPSRYAGITCPKCGSTEKEIETLGFSARDTEFTCTECGEVWTLSDSLEDKAK